MLKALQAALNPQALRAWAAPLRAASLATGQVLVWVPAAMAAVVGMVVLGRYVLGLGSVALQELLMYLHALVLSAAAGYTLACDEHVRIDLLRGRMSPRAAAAVDLAGTLLLLMPFCAAIWIYCWGYVEAAWSILETSEDAGGLPFVYVQKTALLVLPVTLALAGAALALERAADLLDPPPAAASTSQTDSPAPSAPETEAPQASAAAPKAD